MRVSAIQQASAAGRRQAIWSALYWRERRKEGKGWARRTCWESFSRRKSERKKRPEKASELWPEGKD